VTGVDAFSFDAPPRRTELRQQVRYCPLESPACVRGLITVPTQSPVFLPALNEWHRCCCGDARRGTGVSRSWTPLQCCRPTPAPPAGHPVAV